MKTFKAIIYALLLIIWLLFTIIFVITLVPIVFIYLMELNEWFTYSNMIFDAFKKLE